MYSFWILKLKNKKRFENLSLPDLKTSAKYRFETNQFCKLCYCQSRACDGNEMTGGGGGGRVEMVERSKNSDLDTKNSKTRFGHSGSQVFLASNKGYAMWRSMHQSTLTTKTGLASTPLTATLLRCRAPSPLPDLMPTTLSQPNTSSHVLIRDHRTLVQSTTPVGALPT